MSTKQIFPLLEKKQEDKRDRWAWCCSRRTASDERRAEADDLTRVTGDLGKNLSEVLTTVGWYGIPWRRTCPTGYEAAPVRRPFPSRV